MMSWQLYRNSLPQHKNCCKIVLTGKKAADEDYDEAVKKISSMVNRH